MQDKLKTYTDPKSRKKIGYIITKGVWGGAQKYVYTLATLASEKYDVFVICGEGKILKNKLEEKGVRVYELKNLARDINVKSEIKNPARIYSGRAMCLRRNEPDLNYAIRMQPDIVKR